MGNFIGPLQNNFPRPKPLKIGFEPASLGATPRQVKSARANGVLDLTDYSCLDTVLTGTPVEKVWTVGIKTALFADLFEGGFPVYTGTSYNIIGSDWDTEDSNAVSTYR